MLQLNSHVNIFTCWFEFLLNILPEIWNLNHLRHKKKKPKFLIRCYPQIFLSHMVVVFSFCLSGIHFVLVVVSPCRVQRIQLTTLLQLALRTSPRYCLALSLSLSPSVLSYPPYPSLSFSFANVSSCSKTPCSTSCCRSLFELLLLLISLCIHPIFLCVSQSSFTFHSACLATLLAMLACLHFLWWWTGCPSLAAYYF